MNDRFKFRAWFEGRFIYKSLCDSNVYTEDGKCICLANNLPDLHWEQCTGLKDKNGKLIYEGDIVRSESYPFKSDNEYHYAAEVCFDEESAVFFYYVFRTSSKVAGRSEGNTGQVNEYCWEIIGNIHENKELLDE